MSKRTRLSVESLDNRCLPSFSPAASFPVGTNPQAVATADFNNDGNLDLLTANAGSNSVSVLLGDGQSGFAAAINSAAGANPVSIAVGDFNGDGTMDLAAANRGTTGVSVALGNGDGSFRAPSTIDIGSSVESVAMGDFNGDGKMDIGVISNLNYPDDPYYPFTGQATVLLGIGDGSFSALGANLLRDAYYTCGVVADFNGDGNQDMVNGNEYGEFRFLLGTGQGGFFGEFFAGLTCDPPSSLAAADVNDDGKIDVVAASRDGNAIGVLLGNGAGGFTNENYAAGNAPTSVALGDFDRDGRLDIATANFGSNDVSILRGRGDGTFSAAENFAAGPGAIAVAAGDFNGDGWLDVATANASDNSVSVLLNDGIWEGSPPPPPPSVTIGDRTITEGNTGTTSATFTVTLSAASSQTVTVVYATADGAATAGSDYQAASGTLTFAPGETTKTITVAVNGDRLAEPNETFVVNLTGATNATIADGQGVGTIADDEPRISISDVTKREGRKNTTLFTFTVTLSVAYDQPVTMSFKTTDGSATTGDGDYVAQTGTITFNPGETSKTITITVKGDRKREANEVFYVDLFDNSSNSLFTRNRGTGTILNDD